MSPWRRPPPEPARDRAGAAATALLVLLALLAAAVLVGGCIPTRPTCELGTYLRKVDTDTSSGGTAAASGTAVGGSGKAAWRGAGSSDWECARVCYPGQLLHATRNERGDVSLECVAPGPVSTGSSKLPPQGP